MKYQILGGATPTNYRPDDDSAKLDLDAPTNKKHWEYEPQDKIDNVANVFRKKKELDQIKTKREFIEYQMEKGSYLQMISEGKKGKKKKIKTQQDNYNGSDELNLSSSGSNKDDSNLIMVGGIAGEEVQKFGMNLKSYRDFSGEIKRVLS